MRSLMDALINDYIVRYGRSPSGSEEAWLVRNLNPVPLPAAAYLFGAGLVGLAGLARRRS